MSTHLDYVVVRQRQHDLARQAERVRREREGSAPAPGSHERRFVRRLFARLRLRPA
jgi:hypothetical protein